MVKLLKQKGKHLVTVQLQCFASLFSLRPMCSEKEQRKLNQNMTLQKPCNKKWHYKKIEKMKSRYSHQEGGGGNTFEFIRFLSFRISLWQVNTKLDPISKTIVSSAFLSKQQNEQNGNKINLLNIKINFCLVVSYIYVYIHIYSNENLHIRISICESCILLLLALMC